MKVANLLLCSLIVAFITSCGPLHETARYQFVDGEYFYRQKNHPYHNVYISNQLEEADTVKIYRVKNEAGELPAVTPGLDQYFVKKDVHLNILTIPFKLRPSVEGFPAQLNSNFNGEIFVGHRIDKFRLHYSSTPAGWKREMLHWGVSGGVFAGIGSSPITPWTTNYRTMDEYNGFIVSRGIAVMGSINRLTVGLGMGWDYLTDRDRGIWIHQNKPWYGLTLGLNLN